MSPASRERELARRVASGEREAFDALYEAWFARVYALAARRTPTRDAAEAVTASTLEAAFAKLPQLDGPEPLRARLLAILSEILAARDLSEGPGGR